MTSYAQHRAVAKYRKIEHLLTLEQYFELRKGPCAYCGQDSNGGIDRVNPIVGYVEENCMPSCKRCNARKSCFEHLGWEIAVDKTLELAYRNEIPPPSKREWAAGYKWVWDGTDRRV